MPAYLINGKLTDYISVADRGLHYGDGVFETLVANAGQLQFWDEHMARLVRGCQQLRILRPDIELLEREVRQLLKANDTVEKSVIKIIITRGIGQRGYRPPKPQYPTRVITLYSYPEYPTEYYSQGIKIALCETRLACNRRLAGIKHLNRLEQVMACTEWDEPDIFDGVMLNNAQHVIETTQSNLFWVRDKQLCTPDVSACGVEGIMRKQVLHLAKELQIVTAIRDYFIEDFMSADEIFITNSVQGILPVRQAGQLSLPVGPVTQKLITTLAQLNLAE